MKVYIFIVAAILISRVSVSAQQVIHNTERENDFQARTGWTVNKQLVKGLQLSWSEELRLQHSATQVDRIYSVLALSYEVCPYLKVGVDYNFIAVNTTSNWEFRNRSNIDITASYKVNSRWKFSLRERFRITSTNTADEPLQKANPTWVMRSRLMAEYSIKALPLTPYIYFELSNTLNAPALINNYIDKVRSSLGVKYALSPHSEFDLFYRFDHNRSKDIELPTATDFWHITTNKKFNHIIGIFYEYSF